VDEVDGMERRHCLRGRPLWIERVISVGAYVGIFATKLSFAGSGPRYGVAERGTRACGIRRFMALGFAGDMSRRVRKEVGLAMARKVWPLLWA